VGQDLSERITQLSGPAPQQYSLGKSYLGFGPIGPAVVTLDEFPTPAISASAASSAGVDAGCAHRRNDLSVPELVERLSAVTTCSPAT